MKKMLFSISMLLCLFSCSKDFESGNDISGYQVKKTIYTRTAGDGKYDVLGYGYDVTEEYMGENSTKSKVLDVAAFDRENPNRF
ncbi:MAG: MAC/perforin protein, partial [Bacteroidetes bacterium]|nr:MAC/perforin protein [Bacteroidota bacterium]